jgi:hypothetical protein
MKVQMVQRRKDLRRAIPRRHILGDLFLSGSVIDVSVSIDNFHE